MKKRRITNNEGEDDRKEYKIKKFESDICFPKDIDLDMVDLAIEKKNFILTKFVTLSCRIKKSLILYNTFYKLEKERQENKESFGIILKILENNNINSIYNSLYLKTINTGNNGINFKKEFNYYKYTLSLRDLHFFLSHKTEKSKIILLDLLKKINEVDYLNLKKDVIIFNFPKYNLPYSYGNDQLFYYYCIDKLKKIIISEDIKNKIINFKNFLSLNPKYIFRSMMIYFFFCIENLSVLEGVDNLLFESDEIKNNISKKLINLKKIKVIKRRENSLNFQIGDEINQIKREYFSFEKIYNYINLRDNLSFEEINIMCRNVLGSLDTPFYKNSKIGKYYFRLIKSILSSRVCKEFYHSIKIFNEIEYFLDENDVFEELESHIKYYPFDSKTNNISIFTDKNTLDIIVNCYPKGNWYKDNLIRLFNYCDNLLLILCEIFGDYLINYIRFSTNTDKYNEIKLKQLFINSVFDCDINKISIQNIFYIMNENSWINSLNEFKKKFKENQEKIEIEFPKTVSEFLLKFLKEYQIKLTNKNKLIERNNFNY